MKDLKTRGLWTRAARQAHDADVVIWIARRKSMVADPEVSMSAIGYGRTSSGVGHHVRFTPNSGHKWVIEFMSAFDPQRTFRS